MTERSQDEVEVFQNEESEIQEEKPRRRRRRKRQTEPQPESEKKTFSEEFLAGVSETCTESVNAIASHLPSKFFEAKELNEAERETLKRTTSAVISSKQETEGFSKFISLLPVLSFSLVVGIIFLSRLKKREQRENEVA